MPAKSRSQQRLMAQAYEVRKFADSGGREGVDPKDIDSAYRDEIVRLSKGMSKSDLEDYARTAHSGLPEEVDENNPSATVGSVNGMGANTFPAGDQPGSGIVGGGRFFKYADFVKRGKKPKKKQ